MGNYGTDSDVERYLENRDGTSDYEDMHNQADIDAFKVFAARKSLGDVGSLWLICCRSMCWFRSGSSEGGLGEVAFSYEGVMLVSGGGCC